MHYAVAVLAVCSICCSVFDYMTIKNAYKTVVDLQYV